MKVGIASVNVRLYPQEDGNPVSGELGYTAMVLPAGETADVYIKGTTGSITKKANTMQVIDNPDIGYYYTVPTKYTFKIGNPVKNMKLSATAGTEICFILFHNAYCRSNGTGYQIIKVVVGND